MELNFNSVETIPVLNASAAFKTDSGKVFKEDVDIVPTIIDKSLSYIPWGSDDNMPYHIIDLIESDAPLVATQWRCAESKPLSNSRHLSDVQCRGVLRQRAAVQHRHVWRRCQARGRGLPARQRLALVLPRCVPGLQALRLLRLGRHPQCRGHEDCTTDPQGGLLLPSYPCGEGRQHQAESYTITLTRRGRP